MNREPIPVWLLTGFLGSGKTSLLLNWLRAEALSNAAVVINEVGDVGLDNTLIGGAVDSASVLLGNCVCCSGLEGLEATLSDLWWDRLYRKRPKFDAVVIETTGLANPRSIQTVFKQHPFLKERYRLRATLTTVSASHGLDVLKTFDESVSQVKAADVILLTHVDLDDAAPVLQSIHAMNSRAVCLPSPKASVSWDAVMVAIQTLASRTACVEDTFAQTKNELTPHHSHTASVRFVATPQFADVKALMAFVAPLITTHLIRLKGIVALQDGKMFVVHWVMCDKQASVVLYTGAAPQDFGLTCIVANHGVIDDSAP